jgi:AcrR family transcriptional regulator
MAMEPLTRDRRREMTRRHLLDAAAVVFARDGFHGASLDDVAATAGFTKGAVYSNFKGKDELFVAVFEDRLTREEQEMQRVLHDSMGINNVDDQLPLVRSVIERTWDDEWTALYLEFVLYARRNPESQAKLVASARRHREATIGMLERVYESVGVLPDVPVPVLATISMALFEGLGIGRLVDPPAFTQAVLTDALTFLYNAFDVALPAEAAEERAPPA